MRCYLVFPLLFLTVDSGSYSLPTAPVGTKSFHLIPPVMSGTSQTTDIWNNKPNFMTKCSHILVCSKPIYVIVSCKILLFCPQVSATFAASLIISPALGAYLGRIYDDRAVVALATFVAASDLLFILVAVPESLPERVRPASWGAPISWEQADPFAVSKNSNLFNTFYLYVLSNSSQYKNSPYRFPYIFILLHQL